MCFSPPIREVQTVYIRPIKDFLGNNMTDVNSNYSMDYFIEAVQRIMSSGSNRSSIVEQIEPLLKQVMH